MKIEFEVRTFEQRFGERCFCGKSWGERGPCGDSRADWTMRDALKSHFIDRKPKAPPAPRGGDRHRKVQSICSLCGTGWEHRADKTPTYCMSCAKGQPWRKR